MAGKISSAEQFFADLMASSDKAALLTALVTDPPSAFETDWLDFKEGKQLIDGDAKRLWSKALSGFANVGGGILIWGIEAKKNADGIDAASALSLVAEPAKLHSRLMELHHQATDPPVQPISVEHFVADASGAGFVVCLVPEGSNKPYRAVHEKNNPYYMRAGDDFVIIPTPMLRSLFFPERRADVYLRCKLSRTGMTEQNETQCFLAIENRGPATIEGLAIEMVTDPQVVWDICAPNYWLGRRREEYSRMYSYELPIHPGEIAESIYFRLRIRTGTVKLEFGLYAKNQAAKRVAMIVGDRNVAEGGMLAQHAEIFEPWNDPFLV
jgi:hypothetical protein